MPLTALYEWKFPTTDNTPAQFVDIIIIGNTKPTTYEWLLRCLPTNNQLIRRILCFQPRLAHSRHPDFWTRFLESSNDLLIELTQLNRISQLGDVVRQHVIFICFSLSGLILKEALCTAQRDHVQLYDAVNHILFVGLAHNDNHAEFDECFSTCVAHEFRDVTRKSIGTSLARLKEVSKEFRGLDLRCSITSIYEGKETPSLRDGIHFLRKKQMTHLVTRPLVELEQEYCQSVEIDMDHVELLHIVRGHATPASIAERVSQDIFLCLDELKSKYLISPNLAMDIPALQEPRDDTSLITASTLVAWPASSVQQSTGAHHLPEANDTAQTGQRDQAQVNVPCHIVRPFLPNDKFSGREEELLSIRAQLDPTPEDLHQRTYALCGLAGMGKTQIALSYAFEGFGKFPVVLWAHSDTRAKLLNSYAEFAFELGLVDSRAASQLACRDMVKDWLERTSVPWLLVLDNCDSVDRLDILGDFWPSGGIGSILVTSRDKKALGQFVSGTIHTLEKLGQQAAIDLLIKLSRKEDADRNDALKICDRVDYLPLAIGVIGNKLQSEPLSFADYLVLFDARKLIIESTALKGPTMHYPHSLAAVWSLDIERLTQQNPDMRLLLNLASFLDCDGIQESLLVEGFARSKDRNIKKFAERKTFLKFRIHLSSSNLIFQNEGLQQLWMHRLVQTAFHLQMDPNASQIAFDHAFELVNNMWPVPERHNRHNAALWTVQQAYISHVTSLADHYQAYRELREDKSMEPLQTTQAFPELLYNGGWYHYERGDFASSQRLLLMAENYCLERPEGMEVILGDIYGAFGSRESEINEREACLESFKRQFDYIEQAISKGLLERPNIREALAFGGLANAYNGLGMPEEAEPYYRRCIDIWTELPGSSVIYETHLGTCLTLQAKFAESDEVLRRALAKREAEFGPYDKTSMKTGALYLTLGNNQLAMGDYESAFESHQHAHDLLLEVLGDKNHRYGDTVYKLGWHYCRQGEFLKARDKLEQALEIFSIDQGHANESARTRYKLREVYFRLQEADAAKRMEDRAEEQRKEILGDQWKPAVSETNFDEMIMFWSR